MQGVCGNHYRLRRRLAARSVIATDAPECAGSLFYPHPSSLWCNHDLAKIDDVERAVRCELAMRVTFKALMWDFEAGPTILLMAKFTVRRSRISIRTGTNIAAS